MNSQSRREFSQFCKYFTIRSVEAIVQARLGGKIRTTCRGTQSRDWFNVNIEEVPEITAQLVRSLNNTFPPYLPEVNILVALRTADGQTLNLEIWRISVDSEDVSEGHCANVRTQLYHRMGVMLRSIMSASRVTPCYKLYTRRQSADTFVLCYQIYGAPMDHRNLLGEKFRSVPLGSVGSSLGSLKVDLYYRVHMVVKENLDQAKMSCLDENYYNRTEDRKNTISDALTHYEYRAELGQNFRTALQPKNLDDEIDEFYTKLDCSTTQTNFGQPFVDILPEMKPILVPHSPFNNSTSKPIDFGHFGRMPDFSPCFSHFSTSPGSADFNPCSPINPRRPSTGVTFQLGAASGSSSEDGGSQQNCKAVIPFRDNATLIIQEEYTNRKKHDSSGSGGSRSDSPGNGNYHKTSSSNQGEEFTRNFLRKSPLKKNRSIDSFPFARLLAASCSVPTFERIPEGTTTTTTIGGEVVSTKLGRGLVTSTSAVQVRPWAARSLFGGGGAEGGSWKATAAELRRASAPPIDENDPLACGGHQQDDDALTTSGGVQIFAARRCSSRSVGDTAKSPLDQNTDLTGGRQNPLSRSGLLSSSSSSDDSFVHIEMRPAFAATAAATPLGRDAVSASSCGIEQHVSARCATVPDASALLSQCKAAPAQLHSFEPAAHQQRVATCKSGGRRRLQSEQCGETMGSCNNEKNEKGDKKQLCNSISVDANFIGESTSAFFAEIPAQLADFEEKSKFFDTFLQNLPDAEEEM